jgi:hypothetical protein
VSPCEVSPVARVMRDARRRQALQGAVLTRAERV